MTRLNLAVLSAFTVLGACAGVTGWNHEAETPVRAPGLWAVSMSYDNGATMLPVSGVCVDKASGARMTIAGAQTDRAACSTYQAGRTGHDSWRVHSVCALGSATITTDAQVIGELGARYWVRGQSDTTGAAQPAQNGRREFTLAARRLGACDKGQRGGDAITQAQVIDISAGAPRTN